MEASNGIVVVAISGIALGVVGMLVSPDDKKSSRTMILASVGVLAGFLGLKLLFLH